MRGIFKLLLKGFFILICLALGFISFANKFTSGYVDSFYKRFTHSAPSLIIGTSRAAQGVQPHILEAKLANKSFDFPILNYSFSLGHSPFGPSYLESIKKKMSNNFQNGLFIICVDPWALSIDKTNIDEDPEKFPEASEFIAKMDYVNLDPNYEYLLLHLQRPYYRLILDNNKENKRLDKLHSNGWLEISISMDSMEVNKRHANMLKLYQGWVNSNKLSNVRILSLIETIKFLSKKGQVYLVRLPVPYAMAKLEKQFMPGFDSRISEISKLYKVPYFNFIGKTDILSTDGTHLHKSSGKIISSAIADSILIHREG